ncbi:thrombospondin type-1 domain-containing protein [Sphingomonas sp. 3-13AW]|uniref:thrombospondin type-1 domain-containing protein n=1 Tax=Sphingomonas sp. 3-13AW TaxID=3050450 RepID=UPI003BB62B07
MRFNRTARRAALGLCALLMSSAAWADPIPGLYGTGLNSNGQRLGGDGDLDAHYQVNGRPAVVFTHPAYYQSDDSLWVGELPGGHYTAPIVDGQARTYYTLTFDLTGFNPATAQITGSWGVDNYGVGYINGQPFSTNSDGFSSPTAFSITSGFKSGLNTITFMVEDYGAPAAFIVSGIRGTADRAAPPAWSSGNWSAWSTSCGSATRTRHVSCVSPDEGTTLSDSLCSAASKPATSEASYETSGCGYSWTTGSYGSPVPACGATTMSRPVTCTRSDDQSVDPLLCDQASKPPSEAPTTSYSTCSYSWTADPWSAPSTTCGEATQNRDVSCSRSDLMTVGDSYCSSSGAKPSNSQSTYQTLGCSYSWNAGAWTGLVPACGPTVETRSVTCERSDGQGAADSFCPPEGRPADQRAGTSYAACGYAWEAHSWSSPSKTCGSSTRTRAVVCRRSNGDEVADSLCTGTRPEATETVADFSTCSYSWSYGQYGPTTPACGASSKTRTAECFRQDGAPADEAFCGTSEPLTQPSTDYSACTYAWHAGTWNTPSACGQTTRTRAITCLRSDGATAPITLCDADDQPVASETISDTSACEYSWVLTWFGQWTACVNDTQSRPVTAECRRSDGTAVADFNCSTVPATSETRACTTPTNPPVTPPGDGAVIFRRVIDVMGPHR